MPQPGGMTHIYMEKSNLCLHSVMDQLIILELFSSNLFFRKIKNKTIRDPIWNMIDSVGYFGSEILFLLSRHLSKQETQE